MERGGVLDSLERQRASRGNGRLRPCLAACVGLLLCVASAQRAEAQGAVRDLSAFTGPTATFTVSITINTPAGTAAVGVEETPPAGWSVANISDGGGWDSIQEKVKWGPFFSPSVPTLLTYDVTPAAGAVGDECFTGDVSFDVTVESIGGDQCVMLPVPTVSQWGALALALLVCTAATLIITSRRLDGPHRAKYHS